MRISIRSAGSAQDMDYFWQGNHKDKELLQNDVFDTLYAPFFFLLEKCGELLLVVSANTERKDFTHRVIIDLLYCTSESDDDKKVLLAISKHCLCNWSSKDGAPDLLKRSIEKMFGGKTAFKGRAIPKNEIDEFLQRFSKQDEIDSAFDGKSLEIEESMLSPSNSEERRNAAYFLYKNGLTRHNFLVAISKSSPNKICEAFCVDVSQMSLLIFNDKKRIIIPQKKIQSSALSRIMGIFLIISIVIGVFLLGPFSRKQIIKKDSEELFKVGKQYLLGIDVEANYTKAVKHLLYAAEQGHVKAQSYLAICYRLGIGVERNEEKADMWEKKASEQRKE